MKRKIFVVTVFFLMLLLSQGLWAGNTYAISLDNSEQFYVNDDASDNLDLTSSYTFECWLNLDAYQQYDRVFDRRTVCAMSIMAANGDGDFALRFTERGSSHNILRTLETPAAYDMYLDTWYHIAVTFDDDSNTAKLYINGDLAASAVSSYWSLSASTNAINFGGMYNAGYSNQIDALIDEIRVSDIARDIDDMQTSILDAAYTSDDNTVLLMHLNDQGDPPTYVSGLGLTGTKGDDDISSADYVDVSADLPLPVTLISFTTIMADEFVNISWTVESESGISKYNLYRGETAENLIYSVNAENLTTTHTYEYQDSEIEVGTYTYWLESVENDGSSQIYDPCSVEVFEEDDENEDIHGEIITKLMGNYPNPFTNATTISFSLTEDATISSVEIYNTKGQLIDQLEINNYESGINTISYSADKLSSGIYLYKLVVDNKIVDTKKMILLK